MAGAKTHGTGNNSPVMSQRALISLTPSHQWWHPLTCVGVNHLVQTSQGDETWCVLKLDGEGRDCLRSDSGGAPTLPPPPPLTHTHTNSPGQDMLLSKCSSVSPGSDPISSLSRRWPSSVRCQKQDFLLPSRHCRLQVLLKLLLKHRLWRMLFFQPSGAVWKKGKFSLGGKQQKRVESIMGVRLQTWQR